ncbi:hypothetical protein D0B54_10895 [Solimonas sp. K1W22B-7]|uniref:hypothetical protein n=1 Tax=Solimonas sp. K1W22B-7 TaxID=2303331 RepID=UPI000E337DFD|nr:hypothetical protein [Solimonas sp. K1W22B-7]AXQ29161.1 hypothetical protein D0B54_10895 [Solimonas sp. K1W22B-7]
MMRSLLLLAGAALLIIIGGALGFRLYMALILHMTLTDQPGMMKLPPKARVSAEATNPITIKLNGYIDAIVPFKQTIDLPLKGSYDTNASFDTSVPVEFTIVYKGVVPVDTYADIEGTTDFTYQQVKRLRNVKFKAKLPLKFEQPVSFTVPVKANLRIVYDGPLRMAVNQTVRGPVDTVLKTRLKTVKEITTPILARFDMTVYPEQVPVPVIVKHADLGLRLKGLRLERIPQQATGAAPAQPPPGDPP